MVKVQVRVRVMVVVVVVVGGLGHLMKVQKGQDLGQK